MSVYKGKGARGRGERMGEGRKNGREVPHYWLIVAICTHTVNTLPSGRSHNGTGLPVHNMDISMNGTS